MKKIYVTRKIPDVGIKLLEEAGYQVDVSEKNGVLTKDELISELKKESYDAVLPLLTDKIDADIFDAVPSAKVFASYSVGFNHIDLSEAKKRGILITNTPGVLTDSVAEHTIAMLMSTARRIPEADKFTRAGKYKGWEPELFLGADLKGKTIGILGAGRIGTRVAEIASRGLEMSVIYYDIKQNKYIEENADARFENTPEGVLKNADFVTVHVPLLDSTKHLINSERLSMMKKSSYLINTSRGPVIDEQALVSSLKNGDIKGAAMDVYENEPELAEGLVELSNVVITPHIASATEETRAKMSEMAAKNIIEVFDGKTPSNLVT